jgi:hypothetical protein
MKCQLFRAKNAKRNKKKRYGDREVIALALAPVPPRVTVAQSGEKEPATLIALFPSTLL